MIGEGRERFGRGKVKIKGGGVGLWVAKHPLLDLV